MKPWTPEQQQEENARKERSSRALHAATKIIMDMIGTDEDPKPAIRESDRQILSPAEFRAEYPEAADPRPKTLAELPRLAAPGWTADRQRAFLVELAETGCVRHACATVKLSRQSAYALRQRAPRSIFAIAWDAAIQIARQALLDEATERALAGREEAVWYRGEQVGTRIVHNDRLLMFLLAHKSEPAHPRLETSELIQLWPMMLRGVDRILPAPLTPARLDELGVPEEDHAPRGADHDGSA